MKRKPTWPIVLSKRSLRSTALLGILALAFSLHANALRELPDCGTPSNAADDISLHLQLKNGKTVFREGEIIALTAEYKAATKKKYSLSTSSYDRKGRLDGTEIYCVDPDSGSDPLNDYFTQPTVFFGGGLFSVADPGAKPFDIQIELNEWETLPPGDYHLSIVGNRVTTRNIEDPTGSNGTPVTLRSNTVKFQVIAAKPEWQTAQLASAVAVLDSPSSKEEDRKHAARVLQFLGAADSTCELAKLYISSDKPFGWDFKFGLFGSPYRSTAIQAMHDALRDPDHPITYDFAKTLAILELQSDPRFSTSLREAADLQAWRQSSDAFWKEQEKRIFTYMAEAASYGHPISKE